LHLAPQSTLDSPCNYKRFDVIATAAEKGSA
jgi:hypothetical protein